MKERAPRKRCNIPAGLPDRLMAASVTIGESAAVEYKQSNTDVDKCDEVALRHVMDNSMIQKRRTYFLNRFRTYSPPPLTLPLSCPFYQLQNHPPIHPDTLAKSHNEKSSAISLVYGFCGPCSANTATV